jgi:protein O-mannosyl-transferase
MTHAARRHRWLMPALIAAAISITYAGSLRGPFIFDDGNSIVTNQHIRSILPLSQSMSAPPLSVLVGRPLICLSFAFNYAVGGLDPLGYHLVNIASHVACALLMYGLVRRTLILRGRTESGDRFATAAALIWALHPIQTEAVSYVTQRTETFMSMFLLLTLYSLARAAQSEKNRVAWRCMAVIACAAGMMCKEIMIVAPLLAMLYDWMFLPRRPAAAGIWTHAALLATVLILPVELQGADMQSKSGYGLKYVWWFDYLKTQAGVIVHYLRLAAFPRGLVISYFDWPIVHDSAPAILPGAILILLLIFSIVACFRRWWPGFLGAWFFLILGPTSSILPNFTEVAAERRMYLPLASIVVLALAVIWRIKGRAIVVAILCVTLAVLTIVRNDDYRSAVAIWTDAVAKRPDNPQAHFFLASAFADEGDWQRALAEDETALRLSPHMTAPADLHRRILDHLNANPPDTPASPRDRPGA